MDSTAKPQNQSSVVEVRVRFFSPLKTEKIGHCVYLWRQIVAFGEAEIAVCCLYTTSIVRSLLQQPFQFVSAKKKNL